MLILVTPFWVAGAAESMEIDKCVIEASNKSGRRCKRSDELQLIYLMYLDLSGTKLCSFWELLDEKVAKVSSIIGKLVNMKTEHDFKNAFSPARYCFFLTRLGTHT